MSGDRRGLVASEPNLHFRARMTQMQRDGEEGTEAQKRGCCRATPQPSQRLRHIAEHILVDGFSSSVSTKIVRHLGFGSRKIASKQHTVVDDDNGMHYVLEVFRRKRAIVVLLFQIAPDQPTLGWRLDTHGKVVGHAFQWSREGQVATSDPNPELLALAARIVGLLVSFYEREGFPKVKPAGRAEASQQSNSAR